MTTLSEDLIDASYTEGLLKGREEGREEGTETLVRSVIKMMDQKGLSMEEALSMIDASDEQLHLIEDEVRKRLSDH